MFFIANSCKPKKVEESAFPFPDGITITGKFKHASKQKNVLEKIDLDEISLPKIYREDLYAIRMHKKMLERKRRGRKHFNIGGIKFTKTDLERTAEALENWSSAALIPASEYFDGYQISGKDGRGNVLFTGYYSPVLQVSETQDEIYKYPIYAQPKDVEIYPTRREIYLEGALQNKNLELAYAKSLIDIQKMQLQGSGYVEYRDGSQHLFSYGGTNKHPRRSIQRYFLDHYGEKGQGVIIESIGKFITENPDKGDEILFHNSSYVFFIKNPQGKKVNGSGNVPLVSDMSIATDKRYIPTGACLFSLKPIPHKNFTEHKTSLLLAQDVGGGIKGPGHIDLYCGVGETARNLAKLRHYGKIWLLLAKKRT